MVRAAWAPRLARALDAEVPPVPPLAMDTGVARLIVPVVVIGPPVSPVPVATLVTVPVPPPAPPLRCRTTTSWELLLGTAPAELLTLPFSWNQLVLLVGVALRINRSQLALFPWSWM